MLQMTTNNYQPAWAAAPARFLCASVAVGMSLLIATGHAAEDAGTASESTEHHAHDMDADMYDALREKIPLYRDYTNEQIDLSMVMMGPNYEAYVSRADVDGGVGVLVLAHGFGEVGDRVFKAQLEPMAEVFPTAIGFGMSMTQSSHIQAAVDDLTAAGAERIVVVPALSSRWNTQMRQWEYMFGIHDNAGYLETDRITSDAELLYTQTLEDNPLVAEMLLDHALELTEDPAATVVIIVSHGPTFEADNEKTLAMLGRLGDYVQEDGQFAEVRSISLQNDAPVEIRDANVATLREWVESAAEGGREVVVVTNLLATRSIQSQIRQDLTGLDYKFNAKGLTQHPNFQRWVQESVRNALLRS